MHWTKPLWILNIAKSLTTSLLVAMLFVSCGSKEPVDPTPVETKDTKAPVISVSQASVNVIGGLDVTLGTSDLKIGDKTVATWKDDISKTCKSGLELDGKAISSGAKLSEPGKLKLSVIDEAGNTASADITLTNEDSQAPQISVVISEKNVIAGVKVSIQDNQLLFDDAVAATWTDDYSETCKVEMSLMTEGSSSLTVNSWDPVSEAGTLKFTVIDDYQNASSADITLTNVAIYGLENLVNRQFQIDQVADLLEGLTVADGLTLRKVEIVQDNVRTAIENPNSVTFEYPCSIDVILTVAKADGSEIEVCVNDLTVKPLPYNAIPITDLKPEEILPVVGQIESGDVNAYDHIEHLRVAEATRMRDMMWEYGAGKHSSIEYQAFMMRLNTGMMEEYPLWYDNFEIMWGGTYWGQGDNHAHAEWSILNSLIKHANMKVVFTWWWKMWQNKLDIFIHDNPDAITILWCSAYWEGYMENFERWPENDKVREICKSKRLIIFAAGWNIRRRNNVLINKTYQRDIDGDEHGLYSLPSNANSINDPNADIALFATIWTNDRWDADQTGNTSSSSRFPVGFHNKSLFAWRAFPYHSLNSGSIEAEKGDYYTYQTSFPNYFNVAIMALCFQLFAEVNDVDQLIEMVRSTCLTDYIRLDGQTQPLQLMNPAGFIKKYLMPDNLPKSIGAGETISLNKGYYKGVVFDIPGAEVKIEDEWIPVTADNSSRIKAANPMDLEWRLAGNLLRKYGYTSGQTIEGQILLVDDQWNGLRLEVPVSIQCN